MPYKARIALLTNHDDDIYCFRKELIESLVLQNYEVLISCPNGPKLELMKDIPYIYDDVSIDRRGINVFEDAKLIFHYYNMLKKYKPDVVLGYTAKPNVYGSMASRLLKIPYINNVTGLGSVLTKSKIVKTFILSLFKMVYKKSSCIFFQNEQNMKFALSHNMVQGKYQLIPGSGVDTNRFPLQPYPGDEDKIVFNYIGRVMQDKGADDFIEAAKRIKEKHSNTEFNIIGFIEPLESHYEQKLNELGKLGIVYYRGSQKDVRPFIKKSHATIHPSTYGEGMSNVLLESASSGRPLITTDNPGCKETVLDGETGFIYHGKDVNELVSKIEKFLSMENIERKKMGEMGREKVKNEFSRDIVINAYLDTINNLVSNVDKKPSVVLN